MARADPSLPDVMAPVCPVTGQASRRYQAFATLNTPKQISPSATRASSTVPAGASRRLASAPSRPLDLSGSWVRAAHTTRPPRTANAPPRPAYPTRAVQVSALPTAPVRLPASSFLRQRSVTPSMTLQTPYPTMARPAAATRAGPRGQDSPRGVRPSLDPPEPPEPPAPPELLAPPPDAIRPALKARAANTTTLNADAALPATRLAPSSSRWPSTTSHSSQRTSAAKPATVTQSSVRPKGCWASCCRAPFFEGEPSEWPNASCSASQ